MKDFLTGSNINVSTMVFTIVLIFMILFMNMLLHNKHIYQKISEEISYLVELEDDLNKESLKRVKKQLSNIDGVYHISYISSDAAYDYMARDIKMLKELDSFENPFKNQLEFHIKADKSTEQIAEIVKSVGAISGTNGVYYQENLIANVKKIMYIVSLGFLLMTIVLLIVNYGLLYNFIHVVLNSNRKEIKTMQLVGANNSFIKKPYVNSIIVILFKAMVSAVVIILGVLILIYTYLPFISPYINYLLVAAAVLGVFTLSYIVVRFATNNILNKLLNNKMFS